MRKLLGIDDLSSGMKVALDVYASEDGVPLIPRDTELTDEMISTM